TEELIEFHVARGINVLSSDKISMRSINSILRENIFETIVIDYLNIDVELMEYQILSEWDFSRWRPKVISAEIHGRNDAISIANTPVALLLVEQGYTFVS